MRRSRAWSSDSNTYGLEPRRQAEAYVFGLLAHRDRATVDPLDLAQWEFYVLTTRALDDRLGEQRTVSLKTLRRLTGPVGFPGLAAAALAAGGLAPET